MLTDRQRDCVNAILDMQSVGTSPQVRALAAIMRLKSTSSVDRLLKGLCERGIIIRPKAVGPATPRITVTHRAFRTFKFDDATKALERYGPS